MMILWFKLKINKIYKYIYLKGNVWVYSVYARVKTDDDTLIKVDDIFTIEGLNYCVPIVYYFSFWIIIFFYVLGKLIFFCQKHSNESD